MKMKTMRLRSLAGLLISLSIVLSIISSQGIAFAASNNGIISSVEVTQILGKGIDINNGKYYFMNTFTAEKPTAIQVVMTSEVDSSNAKLDIYYEENKLATVGASEKVRSQVLTFIPSKSDVNGWKAGRYTFTATVGNETKTTEAIFNLSKEFSILLISATVMHNNSIYDAPKIDEKTVQISAQPLPVSDSKFIRKYRTSTIDLSTTYDIGTPEGSNGLLADIEKYRSTVASKYDVVIAVVGSPLNTGNSTGTTTAYTNCKHAGVLTLYGNPSAEDKTATLLHELGHIFGNGDEYIGGSFSVNVNGAPYGITGNEKGQTVTGDKDYLKGVSGNDYSGILINDIQNPYNPKSGASMYNRSSFMGSSYKHWTTSMVWEQSYKYFIPNYNNVIPKVYTDGSIIAKRPAYNDLSETDVDKLRSEYIAMLNEIRVMYNVEPFADDAVAKSGTKRLQQLAEENIAMVGSDDGFDTTCLRSMIEADSGYYIETITSEGNFAEYYNGRLDEIKNRLLNYECPRNTVLNADYELVAFVKVDGNVYFISITASDAVIPPDMSDRYPSQPDEEPIPKINPVTDEMIDPERFANGDYEAPANNPVTPASENVATDTLQTSILDNTTTTTTTVQSINNGGPYPSSYNDLSKEERINLLSYDVFDVGLIESRYEGEESENYPSADYLYGFYAWYTNYEYELNITARDAKNAIDKISNSANENDNSESDTSRFDLLCVNYKLYPPQELRESPLWYQNLMTRWRYSQNPKRAKSDTDAIDPDYGKTWDDEYNNDQDVYDPDGAW